jgi:anthranilate synthase/indole-3-glycerol phosphate synthase/phosphoribosylanthranilate isomerase
MANCLKYSIMVEGYLNPSCNHSSQPVILLSLPQPPTLAITATTVEPNVIMGVQHHKFTLEALQYHPESIFSDQGGEVLANFLKLKGGKWEDNLESGVLDTMLPPYDIKALSQKPQDMAMKADASKKIPSILEKSMHNVSLM